MDWTFRMVDFHGFSSTGRWCGLKFFSDCGRLGALRGVARSYSFRPDGWLGLPWCICTWAFLRHSLLDGRIVPPFYGVVSIAAV